MPSQPRDIEIRKTGNDLTLMLKVLGFRGVLFSLLSIAATAAILAQFQMYAVGLLDQLAAKMDLTEQNFIVFSTFVSIVSWLALPPVLVVAVFLPLRSAWLDGRVAIAALVRDFGNALRSTITAMRITASSLLFSALPLAGVGLLWGECMRRDTAARITIIMGVVTALVTIVILWRAIAIISAIPLTVLTRSNPFSAVAESRIAVAHAFRARLLIDFLFTIAAIAAGFYLFYFARNDAWKMWAGLAAMLSAVYLLGLDFGITCYKALADYARRSAPAAPVREPQFIQVREQMNPAQVVQGTVNGQPVTINIANLHVGGRK